MAQLSLSFLGTVEAVIGGQPITRFRSANNQGLVIYLALNSARVVSREVLAALFWPEETEMNARHNLRQALYHLRTIFGEKSNKGMPFLIVTRQSVQFNPASDYELDVNQFLQAIEANDLETAVSYYYGDLLPGFTCASLEFEDWLRQERESLHQLAMETFFEAGQEYLQRGKLEQARQIAYKQIKFEPWREAAYRQLMKSYALGGDRVNALVQFEKCRETLWAELGVEPGTETVTLLRDIESGLYDPGISTETIRPPLRVQNNLPADTTPLVGRELELKQISDLLLHKQQRLVTVVGPGGMGKTRLALAAGAGLLQQFEGGIYFVDLSPLAAPQEIFLAIAAALDYQAPDRSRDIAPQLLYTLSQRHLLLILDNFEHLLDGVVAVNEILQTCPEVFILATSRQRLNLTSENRVELDGLDYPDSLTLENALDYTAVQLFTASARRTQSHFTLTQENMPDVVQICSLVQGMPLGLLLAAAWLEMLTPAEIVLEVERGLEFLAADLADLPLRQRSMLAVFESSWGMMTAVEQQVMAKLSVFRGGFTREAAEQVAGANLRVLLSLVNKSLIQRQSAGGRFTMHELLRQYAADQRKLVDPGDEALLAHCRFFARIVPSEVRQALFFYPILLPKRYAADRDNFHRAWDFAVEQGLAEELSDLARGLAIISLRQGLAPALMVKKAINTLLQRGFPNNDRSILHLRLIELSAALGQDDYHKLKEVYLAFVPTIEQHGNLELRFWTYERMVDLCMEVNDRQALEWNTKMQQTAVAMQDEVFIKMADAQRLWDLVELDLQDGGMEAQLQELLRYFEPNFSTSFFFYGILCSLRALSSAAGNFEGAIHYAAHAVNIAKHWQDLYWISYAIDGLVYNSLDMGLPHEAARHQLDALEWHLAVGQVWQTLGYLFSKAGSFPHLFGGDEQAVAIISMVYHHPETVDHYKAMITTYFRPEFERKIGSEAAAAAWERGKELDFETAVDQVRSALKFGRMGY